MAVAERDHLSHEVGHSAGISRVLLSVGLVLLGLGVAVFVVGLIMGMAEASDGGAGESSVQLFSLGGAGVVVGSLIAAVGMALARRSAGE